MDNLILLFNNSEANPANVWLVARQEHDLEGSYHSTIGPGFRSRQLAEAFLRGLSPQGR